MKPIGSGFSLIELLVVIAIVGILSSLAMPAYNSYVAKSKITTAQADLVNLSMKLGNYYQRMLSYPTANSADTADLQSKVSGWAPEADAADFDFTNDNASATTFTIKATGKSGLLDGCVITFQHDGNKSISSCSLASDGNWL